MPYTVHDAQPFYAAIVTRLTAFTGKNIGLAEAPAVTTPPYAVVYPRDDERTEGPLDDPTQVTVREFQVTCVSNGVDGAMVMQRLARSALHGHIPTVAGVGTTPIELVAGSGITRDDSVQPPLWYSTDIFNAYTSI